MGQQASCDKVGAMVASASDVRKETRHMNIMLVGDSCVGKSSLVQRFCNDTFTTSVVTIGVQTQSRNVQVNGELLKARVFDTSGLERFQAATFPYYALASCVAVTYSVTDPASFDNVEKWVRALETHGDRQACHMLLATKADLEEERVVSADEGRALARRLGLNFFETSAKTAQNVEDAFASMAMTAQLRMLELQDKAKASGRHTFSLEVAVSGAPAPAHGGRASTHSLNRKSARCKCGCRVQPAPGLSGRLSAHL